MIHLLISMLSISLTFPNQAATQNTTQRLISSTDSTLSWSTICRQNSQTITTFRVKSSVKFSDILAYKVLVPRLPKRWKKLIKEK